MDHGPSGRAKGQPSHVRRGYLSRQTSLATADVLDALPQFQADLLAHKFVDLYKDPAAGVAYMASPDFAEDILKLCAKAKVNRMKHERCKMERKIENSNEADTAFPPYFPEGK